MTARVLIAAAVAAVVMFVWGFVYWGLSGAANHFLSPLPGSARDDVLAVLRRDSVAPGMYIYPLPPEDFADAEAEQQYNQLHEDGPRIRVAVKEGGPAMPPSCFALGLLLNFAIAAIGGTMVAMAGAALGTYGRRVAFLSAFALAGACWTNLGDVIWWFYPLDYALGNVAYQLVAGVLMALVVAAIVRPRA